MGKEQHYVDTFGRRKLLFCVIDLYLLTTILTIGKRENWAAADTIDRHRHSFPILIQRTSQ